MTAELTERDRVPHPLEAWPNNPEIAASIRLGRRLQSEACWPALRGVFPETAPKFAPEPTAPVEGAPLMWAMARRLGLDERRLSRDDFKIRLDEMVERCLGCGEVETCKRWLAGGR